MPKRKGKAKAAALPAWVAGGVLWSFTGEPVAERGDFEARVRRYQVEITGGGDVWRPGEVVLPCPRVRVSYLCWDGDEQVEPVVELESDDGQSFTLEELLHKIHNAVVERVRDADRHFFEGLTLEQPPSAPGGAPLYRLRLGS
jgi:hypothetical protein